MSTPKVSGFWRLRKIGKYFLGLPRLGSEFRYQSMPSQITMFTVATGLAAANVERSASENTSSRRTASSKRVSFLSSAVAKLYAMVAASAETLALAAYTRDIGLHLDCGLYCDSAAALGISQRASIGKVHHFHTQ